MNFVLRRIFATASIELNLFKIKNIETDMKIMGGNWLVRNSKGVDYLICMPVTDIPGLAVAQYSSWKLVFTVDWFVGLRCHIRIGMLLVQTLLGTRFDWGTETMTFWSNCKSQWLISGELIPSTVTQSWPWYSEIAGKKIRALFWCQFHSRDFEGF